MFGLFKTQKWVSPNYNEREAMGGGAAHPSMIILHYTGMETGRAALERLCDPESKVSAHYVIEESGAIHQLVDDEKRAWHAGVASWEGLSDINSASIGIEIVNGGHDFNLPAFPDKQIKALEGLLEKLIQKYSVSADKILGHSDVAPGRKIDPGEKFPWARLAQNGYGLWPAPQEMDFQAAQDLILEQGSVLELLGGFGYDTRVEFFVLIQEFHRHFYPEKFKDAARASEPDVATIAKLLSLIRQKHENNF